MDILNELAKNDSKWRAFALKICGCRELADDLVQDMYLLLHKHDQKHNMKYIKSGFVHTTLYHLFIKNRVKDKKRVVDYDFEAGHNTGELFEADDYEQKILDSFYDLSWRQQELIQESYDKSLRQIQKDFPMINYAYAYRQINDGLRKVLGDVDFEEEYHNKRNNHE